MLSGKMLVVACAASAAGGGLVSGLLMRPSTEAPVEAEVRDEPRKTSADKPKVVPADFDERITRLEQQLSDVRRQQNARRHLEDYARALAEDDEGGQAGGNERPRSPGVVDAEDPTFELAVRSVMDRLDWEKDEERKVVRAKRRDERAQRQTALLTERLELDDEQAAAVAAALAQQMTSFQELRNRREDSDTGRPATRSEWRDAVAAIRKQTEERLAEVLSDEQLKQYGEVADEEGIGGRGFGRGRNRGSSNDRERRGAAAENAPAQ